jgi:pimeloyl-ACP methyl ester carboxylesterase
VPLDWHASASEQSKNRAAVAIARLPAKVPITDPRYGGAILINPGGPGGSGVNALLRFGKEVQTQADAGSEPKSAAGDESGLYFDIIGFDPRGINNTVPHGSCFPDDTSREMWLLQKEAQGIISNETYPYVWGRSQGMSQSCAERMDSPGRNNVGRHINTAVVAEDMVAIVEALGQWREKEAKNSLTNKKLCPAKRQTILERTKWKKGSERIIYWGFSYGTILGATFASMHPGRLHRFVVDGVADSEDYYNGLWSTNLQDTDKIIANFFTECYAAGPQKCALASFPDAEGIFTSVLEGLKKNPLPVAAAGEFGPDLITYTDVMLYIQASVYSPRKNFPNLAHLIIALHFGNGTAAAALKQQTFEVGCRASACSHNPWSKECHDPLKSVPEQGRGILCTDAGAWLSETNSSFHWDKYKMLIDQSKYLGAYWAEITMACAGWGIRPSWEYTPSLRANTSHPILWLANSRDPVTPLRNAVKMARGFSGSRVLTLDADGHCTPSAPSLCVAKNVRRYFQTGELPDEGTVCQPDGGAFDGLPEDDAGGMTSVSVEDRRLWQAVRRMHEQSGGGGPLGI